MLPAQADEENERMKKDKYVTWISLLLICILVHVSSIMLNFLN